MSFTLPSFAKVNLHLRVLGKREDGFHDIFTVFQSVSLCDELTFERSAEGIELTCDDPAVPLDKTNLILRAGNMLAENCEVKSGAAIHLTKRIPMGGGLGGGSSNAAVSLIGLSRLWDLRPSPEQMESMAAKLGSDVPFFLHGGTAVGSGRGSTVENIGDFSAEHMIIVTPDIHVSTAKAYADLKAPNLTNEESNRILRVCRAEVESADFLRAEIENDFEASVFAAHPEIGRAKQTLVDLGASQALMSGSGASVFGIFDNEETRQTALKALGEEANRRSFAVAAVSRKEYREKLGIAD